MTILSPTHRIVPYMVYYTYRTNIILTTILSPTHRILLYMVCYMYRTNIVFATTNTMKFLFSLWGAFFVSCMYTHIFPSCHNMHTYIHTSRYHVAISSYVTQDELGNWLWCYYTTYGLIMYCRKCSTWLQSCDHPLSIFHWIPFPPA